MEGRQLDRLDQDRRSGSNRRGAEPPSGPANTSCQRAASRARLELRQVEIRRRPRRMRYARFFFVEQGTARVAERSA